jgi:protein TonB
MYVPTLLESRRPLTSRGSLGGGAVSFVIHSALIAAAVYATIHATHVERVGRLIVDVPMYQQEAPAPPELPVVTAPPAGFNTLVMPTTILPDIPPPASVPFDAARFSGVGLESPTPWGRDTATVARSVVGGGEVYPMEVVEELPVRIGGSDPAYPDLLNRAGIEGQVVVEFVIDTAGRVEAGSVRIVSSTHELFTRAARAAVATWVFQPGRMQGRAVRLRARIPLQFVKAPGH